MPNTKNKPIQALGESELKAVITFQNKPLPDDDPVFLDVLREALDAGSCQQSKA